MDQSQHCHRPVPAPPRASPSITMTMAPTGCPRETKGGGQDPAGARSGVRGKGQPGVTSALPGTWQPFLPTPPSLLPRSQVGPGPRPGFSHSPGQDRRLWGAGPPAPRARPFLRKRKRGSMRSRKGHEYQHSGAGGLFITLAPLQTDVSFYFELALNRSLVSSVSHGLKTEGESGRD